MLVIFSRRYNLQLAQNTMFLFKIDTNQAKLYYNKIFIAIKTQTNRWYKEKINQICRATFKKVSWLRYFASFYKDSMLSYLCLLIPDRDTCRSKLSPSNINIKNKPIPLWVGTIKLKPMIHSFRFVSFFLRTIKVY